VKCERQLLLVVETGGSEGVAFSRCQRRQQQRGEDGDNRDDDKQLDESESVPRSHGRLDRAPGKSFDAKWVPSHEFGKRRLRPALGVFTQKLLVGQTFHSWNSNRRRENRTRKGTNYFDGAHFRHDPAKAF